MERELRRAETMVKDDSKLAADVSKIIKGDLSNSRVAVINGSKGADTCQTYMI